nr:reverse transcriptase domain-containing protein [Tanacetum cinerariifolium]
SGSGILPSNTITKPKEELKGITTRSGVSYQGPTNSTPSKQGTEVTKDQVQTSSSQSTTPVQPPVSQSETPTPISEPVVAPVSTPMPNVKSSIPCPSRHDNERRRDQANEQIKKFYEIFKDMSFEISFTDALILMPKFASTLKALIGNKKKLSEMDRTPMNEHCSTVILNKLPRKLGDPAITYNLDQTLRIGNEAITYNLDQTLRIENEAITYKGELTLRIGNEAITYNLDQTLRIENEAITYKGELTLRIGNEAITYNLDQTLRYSANYNQMTANKIDVIEMACEEYSQEVLGFS